MAEHPELRWVSNPDVHGHHRVGAEAHVLEMMGKNDYARVVYPMTAPEASPTDPVMDCECVCVCACRVVIAGWMCST